MTLPTSVTVPNLVALD